MSITVHETTIKQWVKNHTKDEIALFLGDQFEKKDAEIERLNRCVQSWKNEEIIRDKREAGFVSEIERLKAENAELRREIGGFPHLSDMRQCMIDVAAENDKLKALLAWLKEKENG